MENATSLYTAQSVTNLESKAHKGLAPLASTKFRKLKRACFVGASALIFTALISPLTYAQTLADPNKQPPVAPTSGTTAPTSGTTAPRTPHPTPLNHPHQIRHK